MMIAAALPSGGLRAQLRAATAAQHRVLDALGERFDLTTGAGYGAFLTAQAAALPGLEARLAAGPLPRGWQAERRAPALASDLAALGLAPPRPLACPPLESAALRVGALYVLEGSRLGAVVLLRRVVQALPGAPTAFLAQGQGGGLWPAFVAWLEALDPEALPPEAVAEGAGEAFAVFTAAFRAALPVADRPGAQPA